MSRTQSTSSVAADDHCMFACVAAVLYYSLPPFVNWEVLGAITMEKPSGVFRTGWTTMDGMTSVLQLGVSVEG